VNKELLSRYWYTIQSHLFPHLRQELDNPTDKHYQIIATLEVSKIEEIVEGYGGSAPVGRPRADRRAIVRAFVAKAVVNLSTTRQLIDRLMVDAVLRRICGWERKNEVPSESVFSRAFAEFAEAKIPERIHETLIERTMKDSLVGHLSRDATEIEAREKPENKEPPQETVKRARGRPRKGEEPPQKEPNRLERQQTMTVEEMLGDLSKQCNVGSKRNSKGFIESWIGYKLHLDVADGGIPISCILTSASVHDSQVAIPLASISYQRVTSLYDLMDAAYDAPEIRNHSESLGHVPIIDINPRRNKALKEELQSERQRLALLNLETPEQVRFRERTTVERVNSRLKDDFGGRFLRVRGHAKALCHLMFGVVALAADQILNLAR